MFPLALLGGLVMMEHIECWLRATLVADQTTAWLRHTIDDVDGVEVFVKTATAADVERWWARSGRVRRPAQARMTTPRPVAAHRREIHHVSPMLSGVRHVAPPSATNAATPSVRTEAG
jgi:predicted RNA methylase